MNFSQKSAFSIIGKFFGSFLGLGSSVIMARLLGVGGVGQYQLLLTTQTIAITLVAMGFGNSTIYFVNNLKFDKSFIISNTIKFYSLISVFFVIALLYCIYANSNYFGIYSFLSLLIFSIGAGALLLYNILLPILYIDLDVVKIQVLSLFSTALLLLGLGLLYWLSYINLELVLIIVGISNLLPLLLLFYFLRLFINLKIKLDWTMLKKIFLYGIQISSTNLVFILSSNIVVFLLKYFDPSGFQNIGLYSRATAVANMFIMVPSALGPLLYSKWSATDKDYLHNEVEKAIRILVVMSFLFSFTTAILGKYIITFLYGEEFLASYSALVVLSTSMIFTSITLVLVNMFSSIGKPLVILKSFVVSLMISAVISFFLIPLLGIVGAALAVGSGILYNAIYLMVMSKNTVNFNFKESIFIKKEDLIVISKIFIK